MIEILNSQICVELCTRMRSGLTQSEFLAQCKKVKIFSRKMVKGFGEAQRNTLT